MIGFLRLGLFLAVALTVLYILVSLYARSRERERLERRWDAAQGPGDRAEFIEAGMIRYNKSLRRRLLWLIYVIPVAVISVLVYVLNFG